MNYFKITGFENGEPIEPYGVATYASYPTEVRRSQYIDSSIYYEPITKEEYNKLIEKERKESMRNYQFEAMKVIRKARIKDFVSINEIDNVAKHLKENGTITKQELKALLKEEIK